MEDVTALKARVAELEAELAKAGTSDAANPPVPKANKPKGKT